MNRSTASFALLVLALVAFPATASAATRCVPVAAPGCDSNHTTINQAIAAASNGDTISIAAGTYPEAINTGKRLNFLGAGGGTLESAAGATTIAPASGVAIQLEGGGSLRGLRAVGASGFSGNNALYFSPAANGSYELDITNFVAIGGNGTDNLFGNGGNGATIASADAGKAIDLSISNSQFKAGHTTGPFTSTGLLLLGPQLTSTVSRTRVASSDNDSAVALMADRTKLTIEDSSMTGGRAAELFDGEYVVRRSRIYGTPDFNGYGWGLTAGDTIAGGLPFKLTIEDSLIVSEPGNAAIEAYALQAYAQGGADPYTIDVRGSTILSRGAADPDGAVAVNLFSGSPPPIAVDLRNSIARLEGAQETGEADLIAEHGSIVASSSVFTSGAWSGSGTVTTPGSGTNYPGDPQLDAGFAPLPSSPLIDRGDPAAVYSGELDIEANARSQDGTGDCVAIPDVGAFELASRCPAKPPAPNVAPVVSKASLSRTRFTARKPVHKGRKRGTTLRFTLSEAARVKVAVERKSSGRRVKVAGKRRCVKPTKANATKPRCTRYLPAGALSVDGNSGANALKLTGKLGGKTLKPGRYRLTLTAVDGAKLGSKPLRLAFRIFRP
jgi:hypothetical protein